MRRLPVYFLIDVSESMVGDPIQHVEEGLSTIIQSLKTDPHAIETVWVSVIVFAGQPKTLVPLQEIINFYPPKFPIGGGTSLSRGLGHLMFELRRNIVKTTYEQKGDWKPIVFLFTDGVPTDDSKAAIAEWKKNWARTANMVAISFGDENVMHTLGELTEHVLHFKNTDASSYKEFFRWVTDSIKTSSISVESNGEGLELARTNDEVVEKIDLSKKKPPVPSQFVDDNFAVVLGKCQETKRPYLMKYRKTMVPSFMEGMQTKMYKLVGAFKVDNSYFELSGDSDENEEDIKKNRTMNTEELSGSPTCPCCGNQVAFAMCQCGNVHCIKGAGPSVCPWCEVQGFYGRGSGGFDVTRTQG